ncbi:hypothetical protein OIU79_015718 [Salix purpurea]|uniref:Uncharacterized protein n=1 Tax=Salix purpurea TaxID=77065 RepID=A0A9Q0SQM4_SALPP|nr:hypothetical protein OIU79_015718 [Salix purpurea]
MALRFLSHGGRNLYWLGGGIKWGLIYYGSEKIRGRGSCSSSYLMRLLRAARSPLSRKTNGRCCCEMLRRSDNLKHDIMIMIIMEISADNACFESEGLVFQETNRGLNRDVVDHSVEKRGNTRFSDSIGIWLSDS